jgi:hypothetical protein
MRYGFIILLLVLASQCPIHAVEGSIILSNGLTYTGKITLSLPVQFHDIYRRKFIFLALSQVYRITLWEESVLFGKPWREEKDPSEPAIEKKYLMSVITWEGEQYWGYFHCRVTLHEKFRQHKFLIAPIQVVRNVPFSELYYVKEIICQATPKVSIPDPSRLLALCGKIQPAKVFHTIYAVHCQLGIIFQGIISQDGQWYEIQDIVPGHYDLFFVGDREFVFGITPPDRKSLLDQEVVSSRPGFEKWIASGSNRQLLYMMGRLSDIKAIVAEEILSSNQERECVFWLCLCFYRNGEWRLKNYHLLHRQNGNIPWPKLLVDPTVANVVVPLQPGKIQYDCLWN